MSAPVETLEWFKPRSHDRDCSVYACERPAEAVLRVGGGSSERDVSTSSVRFCWEHFHNLRARADRFAATVGGA